MKTQETLEKFAEKLVLEYQLENTGKIDIEDAKEMLIEFAKWQMERSYSDEEVISILMKVYEDIGKRKIPNPVVLAKWFEQFKKK